MNHNNTARHPVMLAAVALNATLLGTGLWFAHVGDAALTAYLREDGLVEWMQFLCFAVLAGLLLFVAGDRWARQGRLSLDVAGILGLGALVALAAVEEVSWFQRVLDIDTPHFFEQHNRQGETNLHNLVIGDVNLHKEILVKLIFLTGLLHNIILPLWARRAPKVRQWVESVGVYLPPLWVGVVYLVLVALSHGLLDHVRRGELSEVIGAVHYLAISFAAYGVGLGYGRPPVIDGVADRTRVSILFVLMLAFLLLLAWILGVGYPARLVE